MSVVRRSMPILLKCVGEKSSVSEPWSRGLGHGVEAEEFVRVKDVRVITLTPGQCVVTLAADKCIVFRAAREVVVATFAIDDHANGGAHPVQERHRHRQGSPRIDRVSLPDQIDSEVERCRHRHAYSIPVREFQRLAR